MIPGNWLLERAQQTPQAPALESDGIVWTFAELAARAAGLARQVLATAPAGPAPLALLLPGGPDFVVWFHACALAGRAVLPLNWRLTTAELSRQLLTAQTGWMLGEEGDDRLEGLLRQIPGLRVWTPDDLARTADVNRPLPATPPADSDTLAVMFTSGTTGSMKAARLRRSAFRASAEGASERLGPAVGRRWLACMPLFHVGGLSILMRSVLFGGAVRLQSRFEAAAVSEALDAGDIAAVSLVPTMLSRLLDYRGDRPAPPALQVLLLGGAAAGPGLVTRALRLGYPVCPSYGLTESCSQAATSAPPSPGAGKPQPMRPLRGVELKIMADGQALAPGEAGEIVLRGPVLMEGYLNDAPATRRAMRDGWLFTGDLGFVAADGGLHVLDRRDDLVVSGGENVYPAEVEAVLLEHPAVADAGVTGVVDADLGHRVVAWIVGKPGGAPDRRALLAHCRQYLAGFKLPREIRYVDALPRNAAGKLLRRELPRIGD